MHLAAVCAVMLAAVSAGAAQDRYAVAGVQRFNYARPAPTFSLKTIGGRTVDSMSLRGKVVVLNFWATWCAPCKEEMPALQRLQQSLPSAQFVVIAVTADQQRDAIALFAKTSGLTFPILLDESKDVSLAYGVRGLPMTVIIAQDGTLVGRAVGPRVWDAPDTVKLFKELVKSNG